MAKKNGRKKSREIKSGKNLPEKISGTLWAENLPANLFEDKNPEKESRNSAGLTPEEYLQLFRTASVLARKHGQCRMWQYMGVLVQSCLEQKEQHAGQAAVKGTV